MLVLHGVLMGMWSWISVWLFMCERNVCLLADRRKYRFHSAACMRIVNEPNKLFAHTSTENENNENNYKMKYTQKMCGQNSAHRANMKIVGYK